MDSFFLVFVPEILCDVKLGHGRSSLSVTDRALVLKDYLVAEEVLPLVDDSVVFVSPRLVAVRDTVSFICFQFPKILKYFLLLLSQHAFNLTNSEKRRKN